VDGDYSHLDNIIYFNRQYWISPPYANKVPNRTEAEKELAKLIIGHIPVYQSYRSYDSLDECAAKRHELFPSDLIRDNPHTKVIFCDEISSTYDEKEERQLEANKYEWYGTRIFNRYE